MSLVRTATEEDLDAIAALEQDWAREGDIIGFEPGGVGNFASYLDSSNRSMWVAEPSSQIVGYVTATTHKTSTLAVVPPTERYIEIDDLYVAPACRSRSIGSELVETVLRFARARGIHYATVFTASSKVAEIMRFYEGHGFAPWGIQLSKKSDPRAAGTSVRRRSCRGRCGEEFRQGVQTGPTQCFDVLHV